MEREGLFVVKRFELLREMLVFLVKNERERARVVQVEVWTYMTMN